MLTREQILEIESYCTEHKVSQQTRLEELRIPRHQFYRSKQRYRREDEAVGAPGSFIQLTPGSPFMSSPMPPSRTPGKAKAKFLAAESSYLTIELRTAGGTAMRIQGEMTASHLREIISAG